ncbi:MAG: exodeoxyribonuclease VII small subunit [Deferribacteraceae bacterium]|jgi:exodeoxyribonuclease VII small subunit|nr:exodeoxyribonuclease VII small subunit [Deferribacteraceae bacterium]
MAETKNFEEKLKRLEEIVTQMESSDRPLNEIITLFKEGAALSKECKSELDRLDIEVQKVLEENEDGTLLTEKAGATYDL